MLTAPASVTAGAAFTITVTALDLYNNTATGYGGTVHFYCSDHTATLPPNYTFTATDAGIHIFTNGVILRRVGIDNIAVADTVTRTIAGATSIKVVRGRAPAATPFPVAWLTTPMPASPTALPSPVPRTATKLRTTLDRAAVDGIFAAVGDTRGQTVLYPSPHIGYLANDWWTGLPENRRLLGSGTFSLPSGIE
jgi:hypothetical protein